MKIAIELELDETWNPSEGEDLKTSDILNQAITLSEGVMFRIIYVKNINDKKYDIIEKLVCSYTGIEPEELQRKTRKREVVEARQICHHISKQKGLGSLASIGWRFGKKDHASVLHSNNTVINLLETDKSFKNQYKTFINSFLEDGSKLLGE